MATNLAQSNSFEDIIRGLEQVSPGPAYFPGTRLNRIVIDQELAEAYNLGLPPGETSWPNSPVRAWVLVLGRAGHACEHTYYGWDIGSTVSKAVKELLLGKVYA